MRQYIPLVKSGECHKVWLDEILYLEQSGRKVNIFTTKRTFSVYGKIMDYADCLGKHYYQALKSTFINFDQVESMSNQTIVFNDGSNYIMGKANFIRTRQAFAGYLKGYFDDVKNLKNLGVEKDKPEDDTKES